MTRDLLVGRRHGHVPPVETRPVRQTDGKGGWNEDISWSSSWIGTWVRLVEVGTTPSPDRFRHVLEGLLCNTKDGAARQKGVSRVGWAWLLEDWGFQRLGWRFLLGLV